MAQLMVTQQYPTQTNLVTQQLAAPGLLPLGATNTVAQPTMIGGPFVAAPEQPIEVEMGGMKPVGVEDTTMPGGLQEVVDDEADDPEAVPWQRALLCHIIFAALAMIFAWVAVLYPTALLNEQGNLISDSKALLTQQTLVDNLHYYNEKLTNSARMCKQEGSDVFKTDYTAAVPPLESTISDLSSMRPGVQAEFEQTTATAKAQMTVMETEALNGCDDESVDSDLGDLESDTYEEWKGRYMKGILLYENDLVDAKAAGRISYQSKKERLWNALYASIILLSLFLIFLVCGGALVDMSQESWMRQAKQNNLARGLYAPEDDSLAFWAWLTPILLFIVFTLLFISVLVPFALNYNALVLREMSDDLLELRGEVGKIRYYDEIMSSSARMCAKTEDIRWKARYLEAENRRSRAISQVKVIEDRIKSEYSVSDSDYDNGEQYANSVANDNDSLMSAETQVIEVCATDSGPDSDTEELLFQTNYLSNKISTMNEWEELEAEVEKVTEDQIDKNANLVKNSYRGGAGFLCALQFFNGLLFLFVIYRMDTLKYTTKVDSAPAQ